MPKHSVVHVICFLLGLFLILAILFPLHRNALANPGVLYAAPTVAGNGDCSSWGNACILKTALTNALSGDEIWVKAGVHKPGTLRTDTFTLQNGVAVYGGFAGTETVRDQRNPNANLTVLSGDIDGNDINLDGNFIAETSNDIQGNNAYHVVTAYEVISTTVMDGLIITAGQANGNSTPDKSGGGMTNFNTNPTLTNVVFSGNTAANYGGGIYNDSKCSPLLTEVTFNGNTASNGGGMYNYYESNPKLTKVIFNNNHATGNGGGMYNVSSSNPTLIDVTFNTNSADDYGGGIYNSTSSNLTLTNGSFNDNHANCGGGIANDDSNPILSDVTFSENVAEYGGGIYNKNSTSQMTSIIMSNNGGSYGGGIYNYSSSPILINANIHDNIATSYGGGMANETYSSPLLVNIIFKSNSTTGFGGGVYNYDMSNPTLTNVTFSNNTAEVGGGMFNSFTDVITMTNVILWNDSANSIGAEIYNDNSTPVLSYSDIKGCGGSASWISDCGTDGGGNIDADPLFVNASTGDLRLLLPSPAIDVGNNSAIPSGVTTDLDGLIRSTDGNGDGVAATDLGAYEAGTMICNIEQGANYTFPDQSEVRIDVIAIGDMGCLYVDEMETNHPNATIGIQTGRYWLLRGLQNDQSSFASGFSVNLTLPTTFTPDENDKVCRYADNGQGWDCRVDSHTNNTITRSGVTTFSDWAVGNNVGPTAVSLISLTASSAASPVPIILRLVLLVGAAYWWIRSQRQINK